MPSDAFMQTNEDQAVQVKPGKQSRKSLQQLLANTPDRKWQFYNANKMVDVKEIKHSNFLRNAHGTLH